MYLFLIENEIWKIYGIGSSADRCEVLEGMEFLSQNFERDVVKMVAILDRAAKTPEGPRCFPTEISHQVDKESSIWQFTSGRLRLLWFFDEGRVIICTNIFIKKGQKTPRKEKERAIKLKQQYFTAKRNDKLIVIDDED